MPPRLNKRQQRELEELEALKTAQTSTTLDDDATDEEEVQTIPQRRGGFSNFLAAAESDQEEEGEEEEEEVKTSKSKKSKKKKKKAATAEGGAPQKDSTKTARTNTPGQPLPVIKNEKKALKKAKAKEKKAANDELEEALAELSLKYPGQISSTPGPSTKTSRPILAPLLGVSLNHLDGEAEMRRFFGSRVVTANREGGSASGSGSNKKTPAVKSQLTRPKPTWWAAKGREGLSMAALSEDEVQEKFKRNGWGDPAAVDEQEKWWSVENSKRYKSVTKAFMDTVLSGDPQGFYDLLSVLPWHVDTLLQLAEVYRHRDEHAQAGDFVDRALFTYERAFVGAYSFTSGENRLDFDKVENRAFWLATGRQIPDLQRRGCVRTAFEFARLMYSLDPWGDPHGALLHLDFLSVKANMHQWLLDVYDVFEKRLQNAGVLSDSGKPKLVDARLNPALLPGWAYSRALALRLSEVTAKDKTQAGSTAALQAALRDFPSIIALLADKLDATIPAHVRSSAACRIEVDAQRLGGPAEGALHLLSHLYVQRAAPVWKEHSTWFARSVAEAFPEGASTPQTSPTPRRAAFLALFANETPRYAVYRHLIMLESDPAYRRLFTFLPRGVAEAKGLACDPLPPPMAVSHYDAAFFEETEDVWRRQRVGGRTRQQRQREDRMLAQIIPDARFREQLQAFFEAHPHFAGRFPGGILQFAQMAGQLPPDVLEGLMLVEAANPNPDEGQGQGGMPGGFGDEEGFAFEDEEVQQPQGRPDGVFAEVRFNAGGVDAARHEQPQHDAANGMRAAPVVRQPQGVQVQDGVMYGDGDEEEVEEDEESDEEDEYISPMPRVIRNIIGRFFGGGSSQQANDASSDEEEDDQQRVPRDNSGVD